MEEPLVVGVSEAAAPTKRPRLSSLDIVRGWTVLLMIFVDDIGDAYPVLNHSPWDNVTLADFVMPWFLFMVGTSLSISPTVMATAAATAPGVTHIPMRRPGSILGHGSRFGLDHRRLRPGLRVGALRNAGCKNGKR